MPVMQATTKRISLIDCLRRRRAPVPAARVSAERHQGHGPLVVRKKDPWSPGVHRLSTMSFIHSPCPTTSASSAQSIFAYEHRRNDALTSLNRQCRWKHNRAARRGNHLDTLDALAHSSSRKEAAERRSKKRDKSREAKEGASKKEESASASEEDAGSSALLPDSAAVRSEMMELYRRFVESLKGIRGAEPTPDLFDRILVAAYGSQVPLSSVAQVVIVSPTLATATCYDPSIARAVVVAIIDKLELNPSVDEDGTVSIPVPRPTLESRQRLSQQVHERAEACRKRLRNVRRTAMDVVKQGTAGKLDGVSKDDAFRASQAVESVTEEVVKMVTDAEKGKHASIMEV